MVKRRLTAILALVVGMGRIWGGIVLAHQPFFEDEDFTAKNPRYVENPSVSLAIYATLESRDDVDYYTFDARAGESIFIKITIPVIEGQELFVPEMAMMGPGLDAADLPAQVQRPAGTGAVIIPRITGPVPENLEPFSRTRYWERQEQSVTVPEDGRYTVAVWHPDAEVGRYVFVIGTREIPGGDLRFRSKMQDYWTPVAAPADPPTSEAAPAGPEPTPAPADKSAKESSRSWSCGLFD